jgi:hypothetical protein
MGAMRRNPGFEMRENARGQNDHVHKKSETKTDKRLFSAKECCVLTLLY